MGGKSNSKKGTTASAAGAAVAPDPKTELCAAYAKGLAAWCKKDAGKRGDFNNAVFKNVTDKTLLSRREIPTGILTRAGNNRIVAVGLHTLKVGGGAAGKAAGSLLTTLSAATSLGASGLPPFLYRIILCSSTRGALSGTVNVSRVLCPDTSLPNGPAFEIKRPTEPPSHQDQFKNYAKASPDGACEIIDCAGCKLSCKGWKDDCQGPLPPTPV